MSEAPTYVACLTPPGAAAIATIGLLGKDAGSLVEPHFQPRGRNKPDYAAADCLWLGRLGDNDTADDVVVTLGHADSRQRVEIHCHGGAGVVRWLLEFFRRRGAIEITWEEWLRHASATQLQADAAIALTHALTQRTANILLDQYHGALESELQAIDMALANGDRPFAAEKLRELAERIPLGRHLTEPWKVVVAGAPNVGKSSLINALLGYQRAITSPMPGTTRDLVTALTAFDGWPVELIDSAGMRNDAAGIEALGIAKAEEALAAADLCLWVVDRTQALPQWPSAGRSCPTLTACNKVDLSEQWKPCEFAGPVCNVSALTGQGLKDLAEAMIRELVPHLPPTGAAVPFTAALGEQIATRYRELR
jgi:tRNA modification GTPase